MGQRSRSTYATVKGAQIKLIVDMEQKGNDAATMDAQTKLSEEESARSMEQTAPLTTHPLLLDQNTRRLLQSDTTPSAHFWKFTRKK